MASTKESTFMGVIIVASSNCRTRDLPETFIASPGKQSASKAFQRPGSSSEVANSDLRPLARTWIATDAYV